MGCGGIGGIIASGLVSHGVDTTIVTHNPAIADAIGRRGLTVRDGQTSHTVPARAYAALPNDAGTFDCVFLATQPPQVVAAARMAAPTCATAARWCASRTGLRALRRGDGRRRAGA